MSAVRYDLLDARDKASGGVDVKDVVAIVVRRKGWVLGLTAAFLALATLYVLIARPAYTATAQVYVDPRDRLTPKEEPAVQNSVPGDGLLLVESQLKIITSTEVLARVVDEKNLRDDPEFNGQRDVVAKIKSAFGFPARDDPGLIALRNLQLKTAAKRIDRSFVIDILATAETAEKAAELAAAVTSAYLEKQATANATFNRRISEAITSQLASMRNAVGQSEKDVALYKAANDLVGARSKLVTEAELDETNTQLTIAKARSNEAQARVGLIASIEAGRARLDALPEAIQSGTIVQLRARAADVAREEAQLALTYGPGHPALQQVRAQAQGVQTAIRNEVRLIAEAVRNAAIAERTNVRTLQERFDLLKTLSKTNDQAIVPLRELERKADTDRSVYEIFLAKAKTASEQQAIDTSNIRLISRAMPPERKSWPPTMILVAAALFAGLAMGVAMALATEGLGSGRRAATGRFDRAV